MKERKKERRKEEMKERRKKGRMEGKQDRDIDSINITVKRDVDNELVCSSFVGFQST